MPNRKECSALLVVLMLGCGGQVLVGEETPVVKSAPARVPMDGGADGSADQGRDSGVIALDADADAAPGDESSVEDAPPPLFLPPWPLPPQHSPPPGTPADSVESD
jgi:hypothetical protein